MSERMTDTPYPAINTYSRLLEKLVADNNLLKTRVAELEARLEAVRGLAQEWRDLKYDEQCHSLMPIAQVYDSCADELEALLGTDKDQGHE